MRITTVLTAAICVSVGSAYIIAAPVYAVKRNINGKPRAMRAREEQLRRRLQSRSQDQQKVVQDGTQSLGDSRMNDRILDICEVSDCSLIDNPTTVAHSERPGDDHGTDDDDDDDYGTDEGFALPSWDLDELSQITEITIGTPPQKIRVIISISDSDLFVPSSECDRGRCKDHLRYNTTLSSTYRDTGREGRGEYWHVPQLSGPISQDTLHIAGLEIQNQEFIEGTDVFYVEQEISNDVGWDGYLGLAQSNNGSRSGMANAFQNIVTSGLLERNIFSLKLSRGPDDPGELMFGGVNHGLYTGQLTTLETINDTEGTSRELPGRWKVPIAGIRMGSGSVDYEGWAAMLESDIPIIALPEQDSYLLNQYLGMEVKEGGYLFSTDCARRDELEDFIVTLGGHDFVIGPYEYTLEMHLEDYEGVRCVSAFAGIRGDHTKEKYIILGSAFLKNFYSVFDPEAGTISLGNIAVPEEKTGREGKLRTR